MTIIVDYLALLVENQEPKEPTGLGLFLKILDAAAESLEENK